MFVWLLLKTMLSDGLDPAFQNKTRTLKVELSKKILSILNSQVCKILLEVKLGMKNISSLLRVFECFHKKK